jgi:hypothetical protein
MADYRNESSQKERADVLKNDRANTYAGRAQAEHDLENVGRHAKPNIVIGTGALPEYPRLPENSWTNDPVPPEAPLGHAIDAQEPVGEIGEIEASLARTSNSDTSDLMSTGGAGSDISRFVVEPVLAISKPNRRRGL